MTCILAPKQEIRAKIAAQAAHAAREAARKAKEREEQNEAQPEAQNEASPKEELRARSSRALSLAPRLPSADVPHPRFTP